MNSTRPRLLSTFAVVGGLGLATTFANPVPIQSAGNQPPQPVLVANTDSQAIPTRLVETTSVSGTVSAAQSGSWTMTVGNLSDAPIPVRDVNNPANQPLQATAALSLEGTNGQYATLTTVPVGKRLVIENVSASALIPTGQKLVVAAIQVQLNQSFQSHYLVPTFTGTAANGVFDQFSIGQATRLYADPGTTVRAYVERNSFTDPGFAQMTISGYFVDVP
jgi:hypothetical protein